MQDSGHACCGLGSVSKVTGDQCMQLQNRMLGPDLPVVQGRAPQLASVAEGVGRYAADHEGLAALPQLEEALVRPHIRALAAHIDGNVSHNLHPLRICVSLQRRHMW